VKVTVVKIQPASIEYQRRNRIGYRNCNSATAICCPKALRNGICTAGINPICSNLVRVVQSKMKNSCKNIKEKQEPVFFCSQICK
jgi:hypothetical protein